MKQELTEDGQFACLTCKGKKVLNLNFKDDYKENPNWRDCPDCNGTGYLTEFYATSLFYEKEAHGRTREELDRILKWISSTSKCNTCQGKRWNTMGGGYCKECGLEGNCPWGG